VRTEQRRESPELIVAVGATRSYVYVARRNAMTGNTSTEGTCG